MSENDIVLEIKHDETYITYPENLNVFQILFEFNYVYRATIVTS